MNFDPATDYLDQDLSQPTHETDNPPS